MPNLGIDLQDRRVIVSVAVILAGLLVVNWRVFQPLRAKHSREKAYHEETVQLPADLDEMTGFVSAQLAQTAAGSGAMISLEQDARWPSRDPFLKKLTHSGQLKQKRYARPARTLVCSAVFLGGARSTALINGKAYRPGDIVKGKRSYTVEKISGGGVTLNGGGSKIFLPVGSPKNKGNSYPLVTGTGKADTK